MSRKEECYIVEVGRSYTIDGERMFRRNEYIPYNTVFDYASKNGWTGSYSTVYRYTNVNQNKSDLYGDFYLDFDDVNDFEKVREDFKSALSYLEVIFNILPENIRIYFSGNKGLHITVPAEHFKLEPCSYLNGIYKEIALSIQMLTTHKTIDTRIYDNKRLFRIPNTMHEVSGLYKIQLTYEQAINMNVQEIRDLAMNPQRLTPPTAVSNQKRAVQQFEYFTKKFLQKVDKETENAKAKRKGVLKFTPPCIQYLLDNGAQEGQRNVVVSCLTVYAKNTGLSLEDTETMITDWNQKNSKSLGTHELHTTIKSMYMTQKDFGCTTLKDISVCDPKNCKLKKKVRRK